MIRPDRPVVRAMAEEMAMEVRCAANGRAIGSLNVDAFAALLADFDRPATRDAWVRWLEDHPYPALIGPQERMSSREMDQAAAERAHALRDNPAALEAAVSAALETM